MDGEEYIIQYGDTLSSIAAEELGHPDRWIEIAAENYLPPAPFFGLFVGQKLNLPWGLTHWDYQHHHFETDDYFPAHLALARGFLFVIFQELPEVGEDNIVRKLSPKEVERLKQLRTQSPKLRVGVIPKDFSLEPANPLGKLSLAEHALAWDQKQSQLISASTKPYGAPNFNTEPVFIDVAKIEQAGGRIFSTSEIIKDLERLAAENPTAKSQISRSYGLYAYSDRVRGLSV